MKDPFSRYMKVISLSSCYMIIVIISILQYNVEASETNSFNGLLPVFEVPGMSNWTSFLPNSNTFNSTETVSTSTRQKIGNLPPPIEQQIPQGVNISDPNVHIVWKNITVPSNESTIQKNFIDTKSTSTINGISRSTMVYSFNIFGMIVSFFTWARSIITWIVHELIYHTEFLIFIIVTGILIYLFRSFIFASHIPIYEDEDALYKAIEQDLAWLRHEKRNILEAEDIGRISSHKMKNLEKFRADTGSSIQKDKNLLNLVDQEKKRYKKLVKEERKKHLKIMKELYLCLKRDFEREKKRDRIRYRVYGRMYHDNHGKRPDPRLDINTSHSNFLDQIYKYWRYPGISSRQRSYGSTHKRKNHLDRLDPITLKFILLHHLNDSSLKQNLVSSISQDLGNLYNPTKKLKQMMIAIKTNSGDRVKFPMPVSDIKSSAPQSSLARYQQLFSINKGYTRSKLEKSNTNNNLVELDKSKSPEELKQLIRYMQLQVKLGKDHKTQHQSSLNMDANKNSIEQKIRHVLDEEEIAMAKRLPPITSEYLQSDQLQFKNIPYMKRRIQAIKSNSKMINETNTIGCSSSILPMNLNRQNSTKSSFKSLPKFTNMNYTNMLARNAIESGNNIQTYSRDTMTQSIAPINTEHHTSKLNSIKYSPYIQRNEDITISEARKKCHEFMRKSKSKCIRNELFKRLDNQDSQIFKLIKRKNLVPMTYPVQNVSLITRSIKSKYPDSMHLISNQKSYLGSQIWKSLRDSPQNLLFYLYGPDAKNLSLWQSKKPLESSKLSDDGFVLSISGYNDTIDSSTKNSLASHHCHQLHTNSTLLRLKKMLVLGLKVIRDGTWNTRMSITDFHRLLYLIEHSVFNPSTDAFSKLRYRMACIAKDHRNEIQDWIDRKGMTASVPKNLPWLDPIKRYLRNHWKDLIRSIRYDPNNSRL